MQLLLVRHGESVGNLTHILQGPDDPLTERGRRQAREIAAYLASRGDVRALYTSPLVRAYETAAIIGEALGLTPIPREALAEINVGEAAGLTLEEWAARSPGSSTTCCASRATAGRATGSTTAPSPRSRSTPATPRRSLSSA